MEFIKKKKDFFFSLAPTILSGNLKFFKSRVYSYVELISNGWTSHFGHIVCFDYKKKERKK